MSDKPQTTRNKIRGIFTDERGQIVFLDTPGIHKPKSKLGERLVQTAQATLEEVDLILFLVDAEEGLGPGDRFIIGHLQQGQHPRFPGGEQDRPGSSRFLAALIDAYRRLHSFQEVVPISALQGNNTATLVKLIFDNLPEGPAYYPVDQVTDSPEHFIVGELIREKVLFLPGKRFPILWPSWWKR